MTDAAGAAICGIKIGGVFTPPKILLHPEGLAVGTLVHSRVALVGAYQNAVQGAVIYIVAVVGALVNSAFDALVCVVVHNSSSFFGDEDSMRVARPFIHKESEGIFD